MGPRTSGRLPRPDDTQCEFIFVVVVVVLVVWCPAVNWPLGPCVTLYSLCVSWNKIQYTPAWDPGSSKKWVSMEKQRDGQTKLVIIVIKR